MKLLCPADWAASFPLIKRKLSAAAAPSRIIVDEYPIRGSERAWLFMCETQKKEEKKSEGEVKVGTFVTDVSLSVLWTACDLNVNVFMFRSHQWALPGWRAPFWRYSPSVFFACIRCCHFLLMGILQLAPPETSGPVQQLFSQMCSFIQTFTFHAALRCICGSAFQTAK